MKEKLKIKTEPKRVFAEYEQGNTFKASIGSRGIFEQTKMNERFFVGDQWHGAKCGNERPLVRQNVIKRIGEYKLSSIGAVPVSVVYDAEGIPNTKAIQNQGKELLKEMISGDWKAAKVIPDAPEVSAITTAMSDYFRTTAERVKFDLKNYGLLHKSYVSGTGIGYTYWDEEVDTGLYADEGMTTKIKGDVAYEILPVENVVFGDPNNEDVQSQPYILVSQRLDIESVRREAKRNGLSVDDIIPDGATNYNSGERGEQEPTDSRRVTVITKLYKEWNDDNLTYRVMAVKVTEKAVVRKPWNVGLTMYPLAKFCWDNRNSCAYGDSEITYNIPNQIAINKMRTSECWSALNYGMPKMIVNGDVITGEITNDPGQIIKAYGDYNEIAGAISYVNPPAWAAQYQNAINDLASNTLSVAGANDAALGDLRPDNATAIIEAREAAEQPMQIYKNRFYAFVEEVARIWADFWLRKFGQRSIPINTREGREYIPFNGERYQSLVLTAKVDVGASTRWSEAIQISSLDGMYQSQIIDAKQYLERLPKGIIPRLTELIEDISSRTDVATEEQSFKDDVIKTMAEQNPQAYDQFIKKSAEEQDRILQQIAGGMQNEG
jgi:hypothetical protein